MKFILPMLEFKNIPVTMFLASMTLKYSIYFSGEKPKVEFESWRQDFVMLIPKLGQKNGLTKN